MLKIEIRLKDGDGFVTQRVEIFPHLPDCELHIELDRCTWCGTPFEVDENGVQRYCCENCKKTAARKQLKLPHIS